MDKTKETGSLLANPLMQVVIVVALVIGAFYLGSLTTKVQLLEKGVGAGAVAPAANAPAAAAPVAPATTADNVPKVAKDDHIRGNKNAKLAFIEYSDLECPFCKQFHPTAKQVLEAYKNDMMWVYRHFPLSFHANAQKEAEASECAWEQGGDDAFWKYVDAIYERTTANGTGFALTALAPLAKELGLSDTKLQECLDSGKYAQKVKDQMAGGSAAGINGTPGTVVLNIKTGKTQLISGALPFESIKATIDAMLKE